MRDGRLARPGHGGQVAHAHLAFQQCDEHPQPPGVSQQAEHVRQPLDVTVRGHGLGDRRDPLPVHHPDGALLQADDTLI